MLKVLYILVGYASLIIGLCAIGVVAREIFRGRKKPKQLEIDFRGGE